MKSVTSFAPATIANLNVGFDIMGLALNTIGDQVTVTENSLSQNRIVEIINGHSLPKDPSKNCCSVVISVMQDRLQLSSGVDISITKGFASGSGLGSSSASSAAAAVAFNALVDSPFSKEELIEFAAQGEAIACGAPHRDNVAPAILGGWILLTDKEIIQLPIPKDLHVITIYPDVEIKTSDARNALSRQMDLSTITKQTAHIAAVISGLYQNDTQRWTRHLCDYIAEPKRKQLIPHFDQIKENALKNKALAFGISGSGPSMFAFCESKENAIELSKVLKDVTHSLQMKAQINWFDLHQSQGAKIIKQ